MQLCNGTGCLIHLIGQLTAIPVASKKFTDISIIVSRKRYCENATKKTELYRVILNSDDAYRIIKFGFPGMTVSIRGDLHNNKSTEIVAEKIDFIDFPGSNSFEIEQDFEEKSYWFNYDGSMRKELMYIH